MANEFLNKVADILEKTASYLETLEGEKVAAARQARESAVKAVASRYAEVTGEDLAAPELDKLASDETALETVRKMLDKTSGAVESLGRPGNGLAPARPEGREQARQAAYDRFAAFLQN